MSAMAAMASDAGGSEGSLPPPAPPADARSSGSLALAPSSPALRPTRRSERQATTAALVLAGLLAVPTTLALLETPPVGRNGGLLQPEPLLLYVSVTVAATSSALLGATAGFVISRRWTTFGLLAAMIVGWVLAVGLTTVATSLLGAPLSTGVICLDGCSPSVVGHQPWSGLSALVTGFLFGAISIVPLGLFVLSIALAVWVARAGRPVLAAGILLAGWAAMNVWALFFGAA